MNEREHETRSDDIAAYLLGALEPGEAAEMEQHLAACEECRSELEWLRPAVRTLPESVVRVKPPAQLRSRIMGEVEADAGRKRSGIRLGGRMRALGLRPAVGLAVLALLVAGVAGYTIRDSGSGSGATSTPAARAAACRRRRCRRPSGRSCRWRTWPPAPNSA